MTPFNPSTLQPFNPFIRTGSRSGTVLMEAVLCLPLLLLLVTGVVQFARIWEARLFTQYAAYNAARAALVYNPRDYAEVDETGRIVAFRPKRGPVWQAAANTLAWKSSTADASTDLWFPGFGGDNVVRNSSGIWNQLELLSLDYDGRSGCWESNGMVSVTVAFRFPLLFKVFDPTPLFPKTDGRTDESDNGLAMLNGAHIALFETCILPKPWSTAHYPRMSLEEGRTICDQTGFCLDPAYVKDPAPSIASKDRETEGAGP